jgi:Concanavalin A-like lectin/glucanases superfamily
MSNNAIIAFKSNGSDNNLLTISSPDGITWPATDAFTQNKSLAQPASTVFNGRVYIAFKSNDSSNKVLVTSSVDGVTWPASCVYTNNQTSAAPAIAVFQGRLYIAFKSNDSSNRLLITSSADGVTWMASCVYANNQTSTGPSLAVFQGKLYIGFKANDSSNTLLITSSLDGATWPATCVNTNNKTSAGPSLAVFQDKLYIGFKANDSSNKLLITSSTDGAIWPASCVYTNNQTSAAPSIALFQGRLYLAFKCNDSSNKLLLTSSVDGTTWPASSVYTNNLTTAGPAMCAGLALVDASTAALPPSASTSLLISQSAFVTFPNLTGMVGATAITLDVWVKPVSSAATGPVFTLCDGSTNLLAINLVGGTPTATFFGSTAVSITSDTPISMDQWVGLAVTYDSASATLALYVDGLEADYADSVPPSAVFPGPTDLTAVLGASSATVAGPTLQAEVGRVQAWSVARSPDEVLADFASSGVIDAVAIPNLELFVDFSVAPVVDQSGDGATLSYQNGARLSILTPALMLDGISWADVGGGELLSFSGNCSFTIDGWFNAIGYGASGSSTLVSRALPDAVEYLIEYVASGSGTGSVRFVRGEAEVVSVSLPGNTWFHFAASYDSTDSAIYLYINGNLQSTLIVSDEAPLAETDTLLGASKASGNIGNYFEGMIQNCRFWNTSLHQSNIRELIFNQPISDSTLVGAFDFSVNPPVDTTGLTPITLNATALVMNASVLMEPTSFAASIGAVTTLNASYQAQTEAVPIPAPTDTSTTVSAAMAAPKMADWWGDARREASWNSIVAAMAPNMSAKRKARLKKQFHANFDKAAQLFRENPQLAQPVTKTVMNGRVRLVYHTPAGDIQIYEGDAAAVSDCQLWWIGFTATIMIGLIKIVFNLYTGSTINSEVTTRIYNLMAQNPQVLAAMQQLITLYESSNKTSLAAAALGVVGTSWTTGVLWGTVKIILCQASWWALGEALTALIVKIAVIEVAAAATLANVIVWETQIAYQLAYYTTSCPNK